MLRTAKAVLVGCAMACYSVAAFCGQGLHYLPGCGHALCCCDHDCVGDDDDSQCCDAAHADGAPAFARPHAAHNPADCPICQFTTQGQLVSVPVVLEGTFFCCEFRLFEAKLEVCSRGAKAYDPRGPPLA